MSADRIKFAFDCVYLGPAGNSEDPFNPGTPNPGAAWLNAACKDLPFFAKIGSHKGEGHETPVWTVEFRFEEARLLTAHVIQTREGNLILSKVDANLPALIRGHNGTLLIDSDEYHQALTMIYWLLAPLLEAESRRFFLRHDGRGNCCFRIYYLEAAVQFEDPGRQLILDSHLSQIKGYRRKPFMVPGETTALRSSELDVKIYAKDLELSRKYPVYVKAPVTRVEAQLKGPRAMKQALGIEVATEVNALPFSSLIEMLSRAVGERIVGGLASAKSAALPSVKGSTMRVINEAWSVGDMYDALHQECGALNSASASRLRARVFDHFSSTRSSDLPALIAKVADGEPLAALPIDHVEQRFHEACVDNGAPTTADPQIVETFSPLITTNLS